MDQLDYNRESKWIGYTERERLNRLVYFDRESKWIGYATIERLNWTGYNGTVRQNGLVMLEQRD